MDSFISAAQADKILSGLCLSGMAFTPIIIGSFRSLFHHPDKRVPVMKGKETQKLQSSEVEVMSRSDAMKFPLIGSAVLFSLYLMYKYLPKDWINFFFSHYFLVLGVAALTRVISFACSTLFPFLSKHQWSKNFHLPLLSGFDISFNGNDLLAFIFSVIFGLFHYFTDNWISLNIFGLAFCITGVSMLSLGSFSTAALLLSGLFFYDIFWVFGTDVMVTVAKNFQAPVKLLFPRAVFGEIVEGSQFSMLGLGDIVIPGVFIALMLRFDRSLAPPKSKTYPRRYYLASMIGYVIGLYTTFIVMHYFQAAQPALLYLVPCCLGSVLLLALIRSELSLLFSYSEEPTEEEKEEEEEEKNETKASVEEEKKEEAATPVGTESTPTSVTRQRRSSARIRAQLAESAKKEEKEVETEKVPAVRRRRRL
eukprot:GCRY01002579.1.p1 GENE.GCRY01002579.1~~GCRY01002579.1.p1  ORF type:complete len:422 (+),score=86.10 GCRY01002579.1:104-1369(+)